MPPRFTELGPAFEERAAEALHGLADVASEFAGDAADALRRHSEAGRNATVSYFASLDFRHLRTTARELLQVREVPVQLFAAASLLWLLRLLFIYYSTRRLVTQELKRK